MRFPSAAIVLLLICAVPLHGQAARGAPPPREPRPARTVPRPKTKALPRPPAQSLPPIQLEDQWTTALVKRDTATFNRLLAPGFVYTEDASVMDRQAVLKSVSGPDRVEWARNEGMKVHEFGDAQVVTGVLHLRGRGKTGAFDRRYQFTDTWQRRNGRWQMIAAQDYLIHK